MENLFFKILAVLFVSFIFSCKSSQQSGNSEINEAIVLKKNISKKGSKKDIKQLFLDEYFSTLPGVQVNGNGPDAKITLRGGNTSFIGGTEPLYILNGNQLQSFRVLFESVQPSEITEINILKTAAEIGMYGILGSNGVIEISTK